MGGAYRDRHGRWVRDAVDVKVLSAIRCADEQRFCGRRSRVVLTPRRWRQVGDDAHASRRRWWQQSPVTKESAEETVKTIAQGRPDVFRIRVVTNARAFYTTRAAAGARCTRLSLRPLLRVACALSFYGRIVFMHDSGKCCRENAMVRLRLLTSLRGANGSRECAPDDRLRDEAIHFPFVVRLWIASPRSQ
jgi:hypothetical protein